MLINCPRCGFSQPKDQYCASCGVNIENFIPRKTSVVKKLISSTFFQVILVMGFALTTAYFALRTNPNSNISTSIGIQTLRKKQTISSLNSSSTSSETAQMAPEALIPQPSVSVEEGTEAQKNELAGAAGTNSAEAAPLADTTQITAASDKKNGLTENKKALTIKYSFYEIDRTILNYWLQLNANQYPADDSGLFRIGEIKSELMHKQVVAEPLKTETKQIQIETTEAFNAGLARENSDSFVGIISEFNFTTISEAQASGVIRLIKKNNTGSELMRVPLTLNRQNVFFIHWKNDMSGFVTELALAQVPPFQILRSQRFLDQKTELVMIVEPFF